MKRATPTPIQALRLKQQGPIRLPKLSKPIKARWDDRRSHPMVKKIPGMPSRPEYKIKRWNGVERSTVQVRKAGPLAVHCFTATAKRKARRAKQAKGISFAELKERIADAQATLRPIDLSPVPAKRSGLKRSGSLRSKQRRQYRKEGKAYLLAHPFCQITIAVLMLDEADVIKHHGAYRKGFHPQDSRSGYCYHVSRANQIHHRNKANGDRLINFDYVMSACPAAHEWAERKKDHARRLGILCPINCKPDGTMPDGTKQPTTTELLASRHAAK